MSNNAWRMDENLPAWIEKGEDCSAEVRCIGLAQAYRQIDAWVMGLQEYSQKMIHLLIGHLNELAAPGAEYELVSGSDTPIIFRHDKLKLLESGFFRYDEAVPGLEGSFNNSETKSYAFGVFEIRESGKRFAAMSTHLWWKSSHPESGFYQAHSNEARAYQISLAMTRMDEIMAKYGCPGFLMGDFNASVHSLCLETAFAGGWLETHDLTEDRDETRGYHSCGPNGWARDDIWPYDQAIDHILMKNGDGIKILYFRRLTDPWFDRISDHYPLYIDAEM